MVLEGPPFACLLQLAKERAVCNNEATRLNGMILVPVQLTLQLALPCRLEVHLPLSTHLKRVQQKAYVEARFQTAP